jgi:hypothetical protein
MWHPVLLAGLVALLAAAPTPTRCEIIELDHLVTTDSFSRLESSLYAPGDTPAGSGPASIALDLTLVRAKPDGPRSAMTFAVLPHAALGQLGLDGEDGPWTNRTLCCGPDALEAGVCGELGGLVVHGEGTGDGAETPPWLWTEVVHFETEGRVQARYNVTAAGVYTVLTMKCIAGGGPIEIKGTMAFRSPYGYLPGIQYPMLPLYGWLAALYTVGLAAWAALSFVHRRDLLPLQLWIAAVLAVSILEMLAAYVDLWRYNRTGHHAPGTIGLAIFFRVGKQAVGRFVVLVVCMGYGVVRPTLDGVKQYLAGVIAFFSVSSCVYEIVSVVGVTRELERVFVLMVIMPVAFADALIYMWIFGALNDTMAHLRQRRQAIKLRMFAKFSGVLAFSVVGAVVLIIAQVADIYLQLRTDQWRSYWVLLAVWHIFAAVVLSAIAYIWRPNENNRSYAMAEELGQVELDEFSDAGYSDEEERRAGGGGGGGGGGGIVADEAVQFTLEDDDDDDEVVIEGY